MMDRTDNVPDPAVDSGRSQSAEIEDSGSETTAVVFEMVRQVAKDLPIDLDLDTPIIEMGLTSLERMEVLGLLEEHYGGRFPEMVLMDLETCGEVIEAVDLHLIGKGS
jgi:acyl carrier protein